MITTFLVPDDWRLLFLNECKARLPNFPLTELESGFFQISQAVTLQISSCLFQGAGFQMLPLPSIQKGADTIFEYLQSKWPADQPGWEFVLGVHPVALQTPRESQRTKLLTQAVEEKIKKLSPRFQSLRIRTRPELTYWAVLLPSGQLAITQYRRPLTTINLSGICMESWHLPAARAPLIKSEAPPSRAYLKLKEGFARLDFLPNAKMRAIDLGASPGGWSYEVAQHGIQLLSIDRAPLDEKMAAFKNITFLKGDAQTFRPEKPLDLMVCDVIAYPQQNLDLLMRWLKEKQCNYFFVTLKFKREPDWEWLNQAQVLLRPHCRHLMMRRLESNKNEIMLMGKSLKEENSLGHNFPASKPGL